MKRLLLAALLLVLLTLSIPALRERAMPKYRATGTWVWDRVEGPLSPALTPWRRMQTQAEMGRVVNLLIGWRNRGFPPPQTEDLPQFMLRASLDSTATDEWGSPYNLKLEPDSVFLQSYGPDRQLGTEDDIVVAIRYASPYRLRRPRR